MLKLILVVAFCVFSTSIHCKPSPRIVNGKGIDIKDVPYQVALGDAIRTWCGGSIISDRFILTAGHCLNKQLLEMELFIYVGMTMRYQIPPDMKKPVRNFTIHPQFEQYPHYVIFDIAVVELKNALQFNSRIQPIKMARAFELVPTGVVAYASGWGMLREGGKFSAQLQGVGLTILAPEACEPYEVFDSKHMLCAGSLDGTVDTCKGDSGGPLVYNGILYGVVSFGEGCARPGLPGIYANVANLRSFIDEIIN